MKKINREKGFTLTELLAVLVVLALIAVIAYPIVTRTINNSRKKAQVAQYKEVREQARKYAATSLTSDECVTIEMIKQAGFLDKGTIKDPRDGTEINGAFMVTWNTTYNQFEYLYYVSPTCTGATKYTEEEFN